MGGKYSTSLFEVSLMLIPDPASEPRNILLWIVNRHYFFINLWALKVGGEIIGTHLWS
jgi:hypothetical protein